MRIKWGWDHHPRLKKTLNDLLSMMYVQGAAKHPALRYAAAKPGIPKYKQLRRQAHQVSITPVVFQLPVARPSSMRFDHIALGLPMPTQQRSPSGSSVLSRIRVLHRCHPVPLQRFPR